MSLNVLMRTSLCVFDSYAMIIIALQIHFYHEICTFILYHKSICLLNLSSLFLPATTISLIYLTDLPSHNQLRLLHLLSHLFSSLYFTSLFSSPLQLSKNSLSPEYFKQYSWSDRDKLSWAALTGESPCILATKDPKFFQVNEILQKHLFFSTDIFKMAFTKLEKLNILENMFS